MDHQLQDILYLYSTVKAPCDKDQNKENDIFQDPNINAYNVIINAIKERIK